MLDETLSTIRDQDPDGQTLMARAGDDGASSGSDPAALGSVNVYRMVHQALRGRYLLAAILGLGCAVGLAVLARGMAKPVYRSEALIRIAYDAPTMAANSDGASKSIEAFDAFMQSQVAMLGSRRVMDLAGEDAGWAELGIKATPAMMADIARDIQVERKGGAEHIRVTYDSDDATRAAMVVRSVVDAFTVVYNSTDSKSSREKMAALQAKRDELSSRVDEYGGKLRTVAAEFGSSSVDKFYEAAVQQVTKVESALGDVRIQMALTAAPVINGAPKAAQRLSPQQIGRLDPTMARYLAEREAREAELEQLRLRGYLEGNKQIIQVEKALETTMKHISDYAVEFQSVQTLAPVPTGAGPNVMVRTIEELKTGEANLTDLDQQMKKQLQDLGSKKADVELLKGHIDRDRAEIADIAQKMSASQLESALSGRMSVVSPAEVPLLPVKDRRMQFLAAGAMSGFLLPAVGFVALGTLRRRYRYSDDAAGDLASKIPLLGILPMLPHRLNDPDSAADAAQCVHQIRVMLQVNQPQEGSVAYMVTSACPGEGKTSLVAALAMSFAITGAKTLLVDADLIGQRLTRGFHAEGEPGFRDLVRDPASTAHVVKTGTNNLSLLACGVSDGRDACAVSGRSLKKVIAAAKMRYDVVLVDSGPILGSLEASVMAQAVDSVILTISREQQKPLVERAIAHLRSVGARIAGMVFNKAERKDFYRSVGASSLRSVSAQKSESTAMIRAGMNATSGFGSLVDSVQSYMPKSA